MNSVLTQLNNWRLRERLIRLAWGGSRWLAIVAATLGLACLIDWTIDRYSGSQTWRDILKSSWMFAPSDPLSVGQTPFWWCRVPMAFAQLALAGVLAYVLLIRPWLKTPPVDEFATTAEKAFPAFDHRLVTAIQLNRATADTRGMSKLLIGEVTREAGEIASRHNLLKLVDYRRLGWATAVLAPVAIIWFAFVAFNSSLANILVKRQALLDVEIPRKVQLVNVTPDVWPTGSEVKIQFKVSGRYHENMIGVLRVVPEGQPEEFYELRHEKVIDTDTSHFSVALPPMSRDFKFQARLGDGRTKEPGEVKFEPPPQLDDKEGLTAEQVLPAYLGTATDGNRYVRKNEGWTRGEVIDALPQSAVLVQARFNKPVKHAVLTPIVREGLSERDSAPARLIELSVDRQTAYWGFDTNSRMIGYRIELEDFRGFRNPVPIRRNIRMWEDRPPVVMFKPESTRDPDPNSRDGKGNPKDYEWDMALGPDGRIQVIFQAHSDLGIRAANIVYRVIPKGVQSDLYPEEYKRIQHPREDKNGIVYNRLPLKRFAGDLEKLKLGRFVTDLGKFEGSGKFGEVEFFALPSLNPAEDPAQLEAGGCKNFEVSGLLKKVPDGSGGVTTAKLDVGDTVELYVEVFDKHTTGPGGKLIDRPAGYTREAKRKIVLTDAETAAAIRQRDEARQKLRDKLQDIANDQGDVFRPKKK